jgi:chloride channel 3/4/5
MSIRLTHDPGVCIGANSALISLVTEWLSDLKMGYCADGWWLNQGFCCWEIDGDDADGCASWQPWSTYTLGRWAVYVFFAVSTSGASS